jgi:methyl-accepting chemotaxis protein
MVNQLNASHRNQSRGGEQLLAAALQIEQNAREQGSSLQKLGNVIDKLRRAI